MNQYLESLLEAMECATNFTWSCSKFQIFSPFIEKAVWAKDLLQNETLLFPLEAPLVELLQLCSLDILAQRPKRKLILTLKPEIYIMKISF